ncbi:MAG: class I SAM-dependent methyltransferase [Magnetococcales bacterium]|nr:class I SAM-dependent methyltransferase [Magnetococcales bacterium]MBF0438022.1 class I SAM-dependent methyltransferase [Magnetococcales bacterium]
MKQVKIEDFAASFKTVEQEIEACCRDKIEGVDFRYRIIDGEERDLLLLKILKKIDEDTQIVGAPERTQRWEEGWAENLKDFIESHYDLEKLVPKFIRPNQPLRLGNHYVQAVNPLFELDYLKVYRQWIFTKYFERFESVYEFGAGTGFNLHALSELYPTKNLHGLDFVASSVELIGTIGKAKNKKIYGHLFDMIHPDREFRLADNSIVFTFGSLEQLSGRIDAFFAYLLSQPFELCVHVEPVIDLYDQETLFDYLAYRFHKKRGYTQNLLGTLRRLEQEGKAEIIQIVRPRFASLLMEGYTLIVWRPVR